MVSAKEDINISAAFATLTQTMILRIAQMQEADDPSEEIRTNSKSTPAMGRGQSHNGSFVLGSNETIVEKKK